MINFAFNIQQEKRGLLSGSGVPDGRCCQLCPGQEVKVPRGSAVFAPSVKASVCSSTVGQCSREAYLHISPGSVPCLQFPVGGRAGQSLENWPELGEKQTEHPHECFFSQSKCVFFFSSRVKNKVGGHQEHETEWW